MGLTSSLQAHLTWDKAYRGFSLQRKLRSSHGPLSPGTPLRTRLRSQFKCASASSFRLILYLAPLGLASLLAAGSVSAQSAAPHSTVTGTLVEENGDPASGFEVLLRPYPARYQHQLHDLSGQDALPPAVDWLRSDAAGAFRLSAPREGPYRLEIRPASTGEEPGIIVASVHYPLLPLATPVALEPIEVPALSRLTIRVFDGNADPVRGALVIVDPVPEPSKRHVHAHVPRREQPQRLYLNFGTAGGRTDTGGLARFLIPTREADIVVSAPGFGLHRGRTRASRAVVRLDREPGVTFHVRGPSGQPAEGTLVRLRSGGEAPLGWTDRSGEILVAAGADRRATFEFEAANGAFATFPAGSHPPAEALVERVVEVRLAPPFVVAGRTIDAHSGEGVPGAAIWLRTDPGRHTFADPFGTFALGAGFQEDLDLGVAAAGYRFAMASVTGGFRSAVEDAHIGLTPAALLGGWIVDVLNRPVPGASIRAEPGGTDAMFALPGRSSARVTSGPDGSFWIADALHGFRYRLIVEARGYASSLHQLQPFAPGAAPVPVRVVLTAGRQPWGTIVDLEGNPVAEARVRLAWPSGDPEIEPSQWAEKATEPAVSNGLGEFEFPHVAPGLYGLDIAHLDHIELQGKVVDVPPGEGYFDLGVFALAAGAEMHGLVADVDRRPVAGATVSITQRGQALSRHVRTAVSGDDGGFRLGGLLPTLGDLAASAEGYAPTVVESVRPSPREDVLVELARGASLAGQILETNGSVAAGVEVVLSLAQSTFRVPTGLSGDHSHRRTRTDGGGSFLLEDMIPGV